MTDQDYQTIPRRVKVFHMVSLLLICTSLSVKAEPIATIYENDVVVAEWFATSSTVKQVGLNTNDWYSDLMHLGVFHIDAFENCAIGESFYASKPVPLDVMSPNFYWDSRTTNSALVKTSHWTAERSGDTNTVKAQIHRRQLPTWIWRFWTNYYEVNQ